MKFLIKKVGLIFSASKASGGRLVNRKYLLLAETVLARTLFLIDNYLRLFKV